MCHVSQVLSRVSPATCHMSITPTSTATDPPPAILPHYRQQDAAADLDLNPSTMSCEDPKSNFIQRGDF